MDRESEISPTFSCCFSLPFSKISFFGLWIPGQDTNSFSIYSKRFLFSSLGPVYAFYTRLFAQNGREITE